MDVKILNTMTHSAKENMQIDQKLLKELDPNGLPCLHLYRWDGPSLTYGYFTKPENVLNLQEIEKKGLQMARRPTGGGVTFHFCDYAFSFLLPIHHPAFCSCSLDNYRFVNGLVLKAVSSLLETKGDLEYLEEKQSAKIPDHLNFCMAKPTQYDVLYHGKKIGGAAQRKTQRGYLHQGTISIAMPDPDYLKPLLKSQKTFNAIVQNTFYFIPNHLDEKALLDYQEKIELNLIEMIKAHALE